MVTLSSIYIIEKIFYHRFKCPTIQGRDDHGCHTRTKNIYRTAKHKTIAFENVLSRARTRLINSLQYQ